MRRAFWLMVGIIALVFALIGAFLPLWPTTPFLLVAVFAFARSSPRLHVWLVTHPRFGPTITNWQREGAISPRAKWSAVVAMVGTLALSWMVGVSSGILITQAIVLSAAAAFILSRPVPVATSQVKRSDT
ncbi:MAG: YbaN family protein [Pseudomonadota bacterium]